MKLIVGLGNPGAKYARHRHNVGFMAVERIAETQRLPAWRKRFQGLATDGTIDGERVVLLKPETYMNESGRAVGEAVRFLKIAPADVIVLHDELDLAPGKLRIKVGGGNAGHNGLRSISAHMANDYARVRIGIGHPGHKDLVSGYVLHDFAKADADWLEPLIDAIAAAAGWLAKGDHARFQTEVARRTGEAPATGKGAAKTDPSTADAGDAGGRSPAAPPAARPKRPGAMPSQRDLARAGARGGHPAGEREAKRRNALADKLKTWLAARKPEE